ncbi:PREDICTED: fatty acid synthase-like [Atta cephalotes]|uniref:Ketosynthase family 3 (KS3) domain-containing protein n=1 Tax=Atta cephalotes TaxID=12957 RepID=A0A158NML0_ATTCE|nr:PREDICTED: fatty acid synthase-like [Atta cephalotes]
MLLEHSYEAIIDAGINPKQLRGKNTAVVIAVSYIEAQEKFLYQDFQGYTLIMTRHNHHIVFYESRSCETLMLSGANLIGCSKSTTANVISYYLDLKGPSYTVDSACSSSLSAMAIGYECIMSGKCEDAIIGTAHLCIHPIVNMQFARMGTLSPTGYCSPFDIAADGYTRSETVAMVYLQKAKNAKRIYATCPYIKLNSDGYKKEGITYPSILMQSTLLTEFYKECGIPMSCLDYVETHGTATKIGDPQELSAIYNSLCKNRKTPLMIGSVKSNIGHAEAASGLTQIAKVKYAVIIAFETGFVPPNIHYTSPRKDIDALLNGSIHVIQEPMPITNGYIGINSFGFGGANAHMLLKWNLKQKVNGKSNDNLPRLVTLSGRTEESVKLFINDIRGDLSTFCWIENNRSIEFRQEDLVHVVYSSLNFKDVLLATGKLISHDAITQGRFFQFPLGIEYVGLDCNGQHIMGICNDNSIGNIVVKDKYLCWKIPNSWTFEEAATIPVVYSTAYLALHIFGKIKSGDKILIHSGTGGVGQAAIYLALQKGCEVFTTVGTNDKRDFIRKMFPAILDKHIGNSRDTNFEQMIMQQTKGRGVDIVLNSLAEEKLIASVRCLAQNGRFLEIGKFDFISNNPLDISTFQKGISFHGITLENIFTDDHKYNSLLCKMIADGLENGTIKPIQVKIFPKTDVEGAFRYMASGKHIGKIIINIHEKNEYLDKHILAHRRYYCLRDRSYIILGGLGGFGLELIDWLILRGARNVVLVSRNGIKNGYQRMKVQLWKSYGVNVLIIKNISVMKVLIQNSSLTDLGMDSMMSVKIQQTLKQEFDIFLSMQEIQNLTFAKLTKMSNANDNVHEEKKYDIEKLDN